MLIDIGRIHALLVIAMTYSWAILGQKRTFLVFLQVKTFIDLVRSMRLGTIKV